MLAWEQALGGPRPYFAMLVWEYKESFNNIIQDTLAKEKGLRQDEFRQGEAITF